MENLPLLPTLDSTLGKTPGIFLSENEHLNITPPTNLKITFSQSINSNAKVLTWVKCLIEASIASTAFLLNFNFCTKKIPWYTQLCPELSLR